MRVERYDYLENFDTMETKMDSSSNTTKKVFSRSECDRWPYWISSKNKSAVTTY